jgi:hypothetical protein
MNFTFEIIVAVIGGLILISALALLIHKKRPKRLKVLNYTAKWRELQLYCRNKETWPDAVVAADKLLDQVLKRRRYKGKSMGERMVAAQRVFTDNDALWYAHNLAKKITAESNVKLREREVKNALIGIRQALKDLGALENGQSGN